MSAPDPTQDLIRLATAEAASARAEAVEPLHLLIAVCRCEAPQVHQAFEAQRVDQVRFRRRVRGFARQVARTTDSGPRRVSSRVQRIFELARREAGTLHRPFDPVCVLVALLQNPDAHVAQVVEIEQLPAVEMVQYFRRMLTRIDSGIVTAPEVDASERPATPALDLYGKDYTALARAGSLEPIVGRKEEIKQLVRVLLRKQKNTPVLVGEAGVGKTRTVEGLAIRAAAADAPDTVRSMRLVEIQMAALAAGTRQRGEIEERFKRLVAEAESDPNIVLFLDDLHVLLSAGVSLEPVLARGLVRCIGATTPGDYSRAIESDPALERRMQQVPIEELSPTEVHAVLDALRDSYQNYHGVTIDDGAIEAAIDLSARYLPERRLPDKACGLIDQAAASKRFKTFTPARPVPEESPVVTRDDVAQVVSEWTGLPIEKLAEGDEGRLLRLEEALGRHVVGQEVAVRTVARVVRTGMAGLAHPDRPRGVLLFLGPSGVGKTAMAEALAEAVFDDPRGLIRFDVTKPDDERDALVGAVRRAPYSVVLFEEVERASPKAMDLLIELLDDAHLMDSRSRAADFRNTIVVLTSTIGSEPCPSDPGAQTSDGDAESESPDELRRELLEHLRPEVLNRVNRIVPFRTLTLRDVHTIVDRILDRVRDERLGSLGVELRLTPGAYDVLVGEGFRPTCGVRDMEQAVEQQLVEPLAQAVLEGRFKAGDVIDVVAGEDGLELVAGEQ